MYEYYSQSASESRTEYAYRVPARDKIMTSSTSSVVKCNTCNLVINEVLAFIQNQIDVMNEESIVRLCATAFSAEEIELAKNLLFDASQTSEKNVKRKKDKKGKTDGKIQRDLGDIISLMKTTSVESIPIFVAKELRKLPPVTFDHVDVTRLLKDIIILKDELQFIKENYATSDKLDRLKSEIINWKQASLVATSTSSAPSSKASSTWTTTSCRTSTRCSPSRRSTTCRKQTTPIKSNQT